MKKHFQIGLIGYFAVGKSKAGGQEAKTCAISRALQAHYPRPSLRKLDTGNWRKHPFKFFYNILYMICSCRILLIFPAQRSVQVLAPLLVLAGKPLGRKLHYVVIGGWLPEMTARKKWLVYFLKKFDGIYVETSSMKISLEKQGFTNVFIMPNFKDLSVLTVKDLIYTTQEPFAFCTFSRVMKEKGIEDAIHAITQLNTQAGRTVATLDIYGKIDDNYTEKFEKLKQTFPPYIYYKGIVSPSQSVKVLKNYFALLFPTYYEGEGFAGTLLDALAAGIPVIASDWKYNKEIVQDGKTGVVIHASLLEEINRAISNPSHFNVMKPLCLQEAQKYTPRGAIRPLLKHLTKR